MNEHAEDLIARLERMRSSRFQWEGHWQEVAERLHPRRADFTGQRSNGDRRMEKIFDGTPVMAARGLAAALDGMLKPKTSSWFSVKTTDTDVNERDEVKAWLEDVERRMRQAIYAPSARFQHRSGEVDLDLVSFGTGILYTAEKVGQGGLTFRSCHLKNSFIAENANGDIDTVFRTLRLTARQAAQTFGRDKLSSKVTEQLDGRNGDPMMEFEFLHVVEPRPERDPGRADNLNLPYVHRVIEVECKHLVEEGGFHEFPYAVPRWETSSEEVYGRGPGMLALPDVKSLNEMNKTNMKVGQKAADPPLVAPHRGIKALRLVPGKVSIYDADLFSPTGQPPIQPLITSGSLPVSLEMENQRRDMVWAMFFRNVLNLPVDAPKMTATEVLERKEEFMRAVGPTFGRQETDYLAPITERVFGIMMRAGAFPEPPEALKGQAVRFEYASPVVKAQKAIELAAAGRTVEAIAPLLQFDPSVIDNFDADRITRDAAEGSGMPQRWLRPIEEVERIRGERSRAGQIDEAKSDAERFAAAAPKLAPLIDGGGNS